MRHHFRETPPCPAPPSPRSAAPSASCTKSGCWVIPNPWDVGSARYLQGLGFKALATTSSGFAWSAAHADNAVPRDMMLEHIAEIVRRDRRAGECRLRGRLRGRARGRRGERDAVLRDRRRGALDRGFDRQQGQAALRYSVRGRAHEGGARRDRQGRQRGVAHRTCRGIHLRRARSRADDRTAKGLCGGGRRLPLRAGHPHARADRSGVQGGRAEAGEFPERRGVRPLGERSRRDGRAAHQRRRGARALGLGRLHPHGKGNRRAGHVRGLQGRGERRRAERLLHKGQGGAQS